MNQRQIPSNDVRHDRRQPRLLPRPPGQERPRGDDRGHREGGLRSSRRRRRKRPSTAPSRRAPKPRAAPTSSSAIATESTASSSRCRISATSAPSPTRCAWPISNVPVLIQATPDTPAKMTIRDRRDSFCGKMSACNNLKQYGIPYSLTTLHTEAPGFRRVSRKDLRLVRRRLPRRHGLRHLRIGAIGARPAAFNTVRYSEKILEASGISVETHRSLRDPRPHRRA